MPRLGPQVRWKADEPLDHHKLNRMALEAIRDLTVGPGLRMVRTPGGRVAIGLIERSLPVSPSGLFACRITSRTQDGGNKRWSYGFTQVEQTTAGYGGWTDKAGGLVGTLRNLIEDQNGASGLFGNGVDSANLPSGFSLQPIPTGTRVRAWAEAMADGTVQYWTVYENGVDGTCPEPVIDDGVWA